MHETSPEFPGASTTDMDVTPKKPDRLWEKPLR